MKIQQRFAIRYRNGFFHKWDNLGEYNFTETVDEAHLVFKQESANLIANVIKRSRGMDCEVVEVTYRYLFIGNLEKRSK